MIYIAKVKVTWYNKYIHTEGYNDIWHTGKNNVYKESDEIKHTYKIRGKSDVHHKHCEK